ncbi:hypothetical protein ABZP36_023173 [Zizania latifolia]
MKYCGSSLVVPCAVLALLIHPSTSHNIVNRISWAFCVYLEAVSVLPQLRLMQNTKIVEPFTAHYVFALGVARFLSCAHWVLQAIVVFVITIHAYANEKSEMEELSMVALSGSILLQAFVVTLEMKQPTYWVTLLLISGVGMGPILALKYFRSNCKFEFAQEELAPRGEENIAFLEEIEKTVALLVFEDIKNCPFGELLDVCQRLKTVSEVNAAILTSQSHEKDYSDS